MNYKEWKFLPVQFRRYHDIYGYVVEDRLPAIGRSK